MPSWIQANNVKKIECQIIDFAGLGRGKVFYVNTFSLDDTIKLPYDSFLQTINGKFASIYLDDKKIAFNESDQDFTLVIDESTACILPWYKKTTASYICDAYDADGNILNFAPRQALKNVLAKYVDLGWQPMIALELEFFIYRRNHDGNQHLHIGDHRENQPFGVEYASELNSFFDEIYAACEAQSILIETITKEAAPSQYEINMKHGNPLTVVDSVCRVKRTLREIGSHHDLVISFMAKPQVDVSGNSMHIHQSLLDSQTQKNLFSTETGEHSQQFLSYIAGLQQYLPEAIGLMLPYTNSYKRLTPHACAPINVEWGTDNRTTGLRVPSYALGVYDPNRRVENRIPGADCNPYISIACSLVLGLEGMLNKLQPRAEFQGSAYDLPISFPRSLSMSIYKLGNSEVCQKYFDNQFMKFFLSIKEVELASYNQQITMWELDYLNGVI